MSLENLVRAIFPAPKLGAKSQEERFQGFSWLEKMYDWLEKMYGWLEKMYGWLFC